MIWTSWNLHEKSVENIIYVFETKKSGRFAAGSARFVADANVTFHFAYPYKLKRCPMKLNYFWGLNPDKNSIFYRKLWFSIGDSISIGWHRSNIHFQNISRSAAQMYQSLTASFGFVEFLSGTLNFYRVHWKTSHSKISIGDKRTLTDISNVPAVENISVGWFCWISIGNFEFLSEISILSLIGKFQKHNFYRM